jgi:integrase/recombinase XerD
VAALRFFYRVSSPRDTVVTRLPYGKRPKRLLAVRSPQQVALFLDTVHDRTVRMVLRTISATGLRISEALHLTAAQIDSSRMVVRVLGKGQKERLVPLSGRLWEELRTYWCETRPTPGMFPGKERPQPLNAATVQKACQRPAATRDCRGSPRTPCATAMPRISWKRESTPERSQPC